MHASVEYTCEVEQSDCICHLCTMLHENMGATDRFARLQQRHACRLDMTGHSASKYCVE